MRTIHEITSTDRRSSILLFVAMLVGFSQFGFDQFSPWVIATPFVLLAWMDIEAAWKAAGSKDRVVEDAGRGTLAQATTGFVFHGVLIGVVVMASHDAKEGGFRTTAPRYGKQDARVMAANASCEGGCGGGAVTASISGGARSACGCGGGATTGHAKVTKVPMPAGAGPMPDAAPLPSPRPPAVSRANAPVPGVAVQPVSISPQALSVIASQPKITVPRPPAAPIAKSAAPANVPPVTPAPSTPRPPSTSAALKEDSPKETKGTKKPEPRTATQDSKTGNREPATGNPPN